MRLENGKLVFERKDCHWCKEGKRPGTKPCPTCKGTGKGTRGKPRGCQKCYGNRTVPDFDNPVACPTCKGNYKDFAAEDYHDYLPDAIWQSLPFKVERRAAGMGFNENYIGLGYVFCCDDYGGAWRGTDEAVIADVKAHGSHQASKVAREDGTLCDYVLITVKPGGYTVKAVFAETAAPAVSVS